MAQKQRINSKRKGSAAELELSKILTKRFGRSFARVGVSSGARPKQVSLDGNATEIFTGDLIVPDGFRFSIECKAVNKNIDFLDQSTLLDKFLEQATKDALSIGKLPMVCWKRNRKGWLAIVPVPAFSRSELPLYCGCYNRWFVCKLEILLEVDDSFWFEEDVAQ
jgi:Holliday junction resolvase